MKLNPAMVHHLTKNQSHAYYSKLSAILIFCKYDVDFEALKAEAAATSNGQGNFRESNLRDWLEANYGADYSLAEFRLKTVPTTDHISTTEFNREYNLILDANDMTFIAEGTALSFFFMLKEEDDNTYDSANPATETIVGTVGKIGDVEEKDMMLTDNVFTSNTQLVKNNIRATVLC